MKNALCALLALCLCLLPAGCASPASSEEEAEAAAFPLTSDASVVGSDQVLLYYLSEDEQRLVPTLGTVTVLANETLAEAVVEKLLDAPENGDLKPVLPISANIHLLSLELSNRVATLDLSGRFSDMDRQRQYAARMAIVNTLVGTGLVDYVNVLIEGRNPFSTGLPAGASAGGGNDLSSAYLLYLAENTLASGEEIQRNVTLYFASEDGSLLIPEVRRVSVTAQDYITPVIAELVKGPRNTQTLRRTLSSDTALLAVPTLARDSLGTRVELDFSYSFGKYLEESGLSEKLIFGSIVYTLYTYVPNLTELRIRINGRQVTLVEDTVLRDGVFERSAFAYMAGSVMKLFFPDGEGRLVAEARSVLHKSASLPRARLEALIAGPSGEGLHSPFPEGFTGEDVIGILSVGGLALLNLSEEGLGKMRTLPAERERACVYAIVNTLASEGARRVLFLCEGEPIDSFAGQIDLQEPLLFNKSLVRA